MWRPASTPEPAGRCDLHGGAPRTGRAPVDEVEHFVDRERRTGQRCGHCAGFGCVPTRGQLSRQRRPGRVAIAAVQVKTARTGWAARYHQRPTTTTPSRIATLI